GEFACPLGPTVRLTARPPERLFHLVLESHDGRAPGADSEEKHEPVSDIDTVVVDSLKALDPEWPIREADIDQPLLDHLVSDQQEITGNFQIEAFGGFEIDNKVILDRLLDRKLGCWLTGQICSACFG